MLLKYLKYNCKKSNWHLSQGYLIRFFFFENKKLLFFLMQYIYTNLYISKKFSDQQTKIKFFKFKIKNFLVIMLILFFKILKKEKKGIITVTKSLISSQ